MSKRPTLEALEQEHYVSKGLPVPMTAQTVPGAVVITSHHILDGETVIETACRDYDHYKSLPVVVLYQGITCGLTGWNSDRGYACYKSGARIAHKVGK